MTNLGPTPIRMYGPHRGDPNADAHRAALLSWCTVNGLDPARMSGDDSIDVDEHNISYTNAVDGSVGRTLRDGNPTIYTRGATPLRVRPVGMIVGDRFCGHLKAVVIDADEYRFTVMTCRVHIDPDTGRHPGAHTDSTTGDKWANEYPGTSAFRDWQPDVTGMSPGEVHALILGRLDQAGARNPHTVPSRVLIQLGPHLAGIRAIIERHAPARSYLWPDEDYIDAAAGLVYGLQAPA